MKSRAIFVSGVGGKSEGLGLWPLGPTGGHVSGRRGQRPIAGPAVNAGGAASGRRGPARGTGVGTLTTEWNAAIVRSTRSHGRK